MRNLSLSVFIIFFITLLFSSLSKAGNLYTESKSKTELVDMFMGVQGFSNCVIGPQLPHGSVNPSPQTPNGHHDGYDPKESIRGFGQLHVSGTGWGRYGQIFISPQIGFNANEEGHDSPKSGEVATPYYYSVNLLRYGIKVEITPTHNCSLYRLTFPKSDNANILLDIAHNIPQHIVPIVKGKFIGGDVAYDKGTNTIKGWGEYKGGFGSEEPYKVFFVAKLDVKLKDVVITNNDSNALYARLQLPDNITTINLNFGISMRSIENAQRFLNSEVGSLPFDKVKANAKIKWDKVLSTINVKGGSVAERRLFYTTLYHSFLMPRDRTGDNPNWESDMPHFDDHYCVWDTWRTKFPLMTLLNQSFVSKNINSFIDRFIHDGKCTPTYTSSLEWDWKQGGDDVDNIIADAFVKNVKGFDRTKAYELVKWDAFNARNKSYLKYGWQPEAGERMSCSNTMEFAYNDFCGAEVAKAMDDLKTADLLNERSGNWVKLFNPELESFGFKGFVSPRTESNEWKTIDPSNRYGSWVEYFYEGNSWVYSLFTPHQFGKLIDMCGGKDKMIERLSYGFDQNLIELDNEPGFLSPFIFSHCDRPDLTAKYVDKIRSYRFSLEKGYPENEDSGAMGSWYVFTTIGFFPNAGQDFYYLLPPVFPEIVLTMENGKIIKIKTIKSSPNAKYIESVTMNGKALDRSWIRHAEIANGAELIFKLTEKTNKWIINQIPTK